MKQKIILLCVLVLGIISFFILKPSNKVIKNNPSPSEETSGMISVLVDGVEQSAFPSKGSAEYQSTSCTNGETAEWDPVNWKLSIRDISASTRCVVSFATGGHNVYVSVSGGTVEGAPKNVPHNGNVTFTVGASSEHYVFSSAKCTGANGYSWANNVLSVKGVVSDAYCDVVFSRPTYTVYFNVVGGFTEDNYLTVVRGGGNSTTFGAVPGYLISGSKIECLPKEAITAKITGSRVVISNVLASGDCTITCAKDSSSYLPGGAVYNVGDEVSYANLAWLVVSSDSETVTLILKANATYESTSSSNLTGTGIFGSGVTYTSSSARSYLVDIWLEQDAQKYLRTAIESEGLKYQDDANGFVRLPYMSEVNSKIPNGSGTNFWTMDNDGNGHVYYGQPNGYGTEGLATDGKYYYEHYTLATNTSVTYTWNAKVTGKFTPTTGAYYGISCAAGTGNGSGTNAYPAYCGSSGNTYYSTDYTTYSYACTNYQCYRGGYQTSSVTASGSKCNEYANIGCTSGSCAVNNPATGTSNVTASCTKTGLNPYSGNSYNAGQYSNGYVKWVKNVKSSETKSSAATLGTTLNYTNTTDGNNDMTTAIQAVLPTSSEARINDSSPTNNGNINIPSSAHSALTGVSVTGSWYQGYGASCAAIKKTPTASIAANAGSCDVSTYVKYTLKAYNSSTMGYRPVIVVYKAN